MRSGDRILGFAELKDQLSISGELHRWAAMDQRSGMPLIVVSPGNMARLRPGATKRFDQAYRNRPSHPAVLSCIEHGVVGGRNVAILPEHLPFPSHQLSIEEGLQSLYWLIPGVIESASHLQAEVRQEDLVQSPSGEIFVSPSGIVRPESISQLPIHLAPEVLRSEPVDSIAACLYGLGAFIFKAVTGKHHIQARTMEQLLAAHAHPIDINQHLPSANQPLAQLLANLLSSEPSNRLTAAQDLPEIEQSPYLPFEHQSKPVQTGSQQHLAQYLNRQSLTLKKWTVMLYPPGPNRSAIRRIAAKAHLESTSLIQALRTGLTVPLGSFQDLGEAQQFLETLTEPDAELRVTETGHASRLSWWFAGSLTGLTGAAVALIAMGASAPVVAGLAASTVALVSSGYQLTKRSSRLKKTREGLRQGHRRPAVDDTLLSVSQTIQDARRTVYTQDLPPVIEVELNASLDALQDDLEDLFEQRREELGQSKVRRRINRIDLAARQIREAAQQSTGEDSDSTTVATAILRAQAAKKSLRTDETER